MRRLRALDPGKRDSISLSLTVATGAHADPLTVLDVPYAPKDERGKMVDAGARATAAYLGDLHSVNYYRWLLWQLLRLYDRGQDYFAATMLQAALLGALEAGVSEDCRA